MYNTTIVSAFISNINNHRDIEKYIECGKKLLEIDVPKIIFVEQNIYDIYLIDNCYNNTKFIIIKKEDIYFYEYYDKILNFNILKGNDTKDTLEYMFTMCNKTEWVKQAIEINFYNTKQFIWLDFGIYHVMNNNLDFNDNIVKLYDKEYDNIRIASCWDLDMVYNIDNVYKYVAWYFAGGVFGGNCEKLLIFADLMKKKCLDIIEEKQHLMWEVNIWYLIYKDNKELFDPYTANHNRSIITNY
jgi:hypothetical protein